MDKLTKKTPSSIDSSMNGSNTPILNNYMKQEYVNEVNNESNAVQIHSTTLPKRIDVNECRFK